MERIDATELWRYIPPEEKFDLMSRSHAKGILAAVITIVVASTCAVGLRVNWLMWASILVSPLIFQFSAAKAWRDLRPRLMLEYLAARSVARRFAFMRQSRALTPEFLFRGVAEEQFDSETVQQAMEAMISKTKENEVWVALFNDIVVMMSEGAGGARLQFSCPINEKLTIRGESPSGRGDYAPDKELFLSYEERKNLVQTVRLTSKHPAALIVFEKKLRYLLDPPKYSLAEEIPEVVRNQFGDEDDGEFQRMPL